MSGGARGLEALLRPRSVAVIGASRRRGTIGGEIFHNLVSRSFPGPVFPVNPAAKVVQSVRAYATVLDVPDEVDLAVLAIPASQVAAAVEECGRKGVKGLVVISAGFGELGAEGRSNQAQLLDRVRAYGMRMVGPNCLGLLNTDPDAELNATFAPTWPPAGGIAFSSQSGALGLAILDHARELGIGISEFVSVGNKADVSGNDLLEHWEVDPRTRVILLYLESFGNPRRFMEIAPRVARKKPIVAVKSGRTQAGAVAARSHTGALAGMDVAIDSLLGQAGVIRTDTIEELFDVAMLLANQPVPRGNRVAILTNGGGPGIMAADACETHGLALPPLGAATAAALRAFLPAEASISNPVDMIASASADSFEKALRVLVADPAFDAVIVLFVPPLVTDAAAVAAAIRRGGAEATKPIATCFVGTHGVPEGLSSLRQGHYPSYAFPEAAAIALSRAARYGQWLARPPGNVPDLPWVSLERARAILGADVPTEGRWLGPDEVSDVLDAYGIATPRAILVPPDESAVVEAAERLEFPVAMKVVSSTLTHKTDVGGVALDVADTDEARLAFRRMVRRIEELGRRREMTGVLVQEMVTGGVETFAGVTRARGFGPIIAFGIGGVNVEIWKDLVFRVHPLKDVDASDMVAQIKGAKLLDGYRGSPAVDRAALCQVLLRLSRLVGDLPEVAEMDMNPLLAFPPGRPPVALDARIRVLGARPDSNNPPRA